MKIIAANFKMNLTKKEIDNYLKEHREYKLVDYYIDDGYSGTNFDRPEFQRMLEDIKNKKIDVILIKDLSRLDINPAREEN